MEKTLVIRYHEYPSVDALNQEEKELMLAAVNATRSAYAPYSHFHVGCALRLDDGTIVTGSNQENEAYPSGLCAERTALFSAGAHHPGKMICQLCIAAVDSDGHLAEASPCGACRQVLLECRKRQSQPIAVLVGRDDGSVRLFDDIDALIPFAFSCH